jgi:hypothetical protein
LFFKIKLGGTNVQKITINERNRFECFIKKWLITDKKGASMLTEAQVQIYAITVTITVASITLAA